MKISDIQRWLTSSLKSRRRAVRRLSDVGLGSSALEDRVCLSAVSSVGINADWFWTANDEADESANSSVDAEEKRFLVQLTDTAASDARLASEAQSYFDQSPFDLRVMAGLGLTGQILVSSSEQDVSKIVSALEDNDAVAYFDEDFMVSASATLPNEQTESAEFARQYSLDDIDAPNAWDITVGGTETVVAVIDSGTDFTHPDLYLNVWLNQQEIPQEFTDANSSNRLVDTDSDGLITFYDLASGQNASFTTDLNQNGYIDAADLLDDPRWADGIDNDRNGFEDDLVGWDFVDNDNRPFDEHRHGTHVAGILGATGNNGIGIAGINWRTSVMSLRFLDRSRHGEISDAIEAINYTTMMRTREDHPVNVGVSNNSWGSPGIFSQHLHDAVAGNAAADILFVAAAGNGNVLRRGDDNDTIPFYPANLELDNVISVAALNDRGELLTLSNFGDRTVDIAAPGASIISAVPGGHYGQRSGTSMAAPHVSGVAALVRQHFPNATTAEVKDAILGGAGSVDSLTGAIAEGRSLNALGALTASTFAPVPQLTDIPQITNTGSTEIVITVTYEDDGSVDETSFDIRDIELTREHFSETLLTPVEATETTVNGKPAVEYRFPAPGDEWDATENGTWFVKLREGEIRDNETLYSAPRQLGHFTINIRDPNVYFVNTNRDTPDANNSDGVPADSDGRVSLRAAVMHANRASAATTIVIPDGVYSLAAPGPNEDAAATGDLDLTSPHGITIIGGGAFATTIDAQRLDRVFDIAGGTSATIQGITITKGNADEGGGIRNSGTLTVDATIVSSNTADTAGGGIYSTGTLNITESSIEENQTTSRFFGLGGGGLAVVGRVEDLISFTVRDSSLAFNVSTEAGGGLLLVDVNGDISRSTIHGNRAERGGGGGIRLRSRASHVVSVNRSTVTDNSASNGAGGGLSTDTTGRSVIYSSIIADNSARLSDDVDGLVASGGNNVFGKENANDPQWRTLLRGNEVVDFDRIGNAQAPYPSSLQPLKRNGVIWVRDPIVGGAASAAGTAGHATPAIARGTPLRYSNGEVEPNDSTATAMLLDKRGWSLDTVPEIDGSSTTPHVTIEGTGDGTFDFYSFQVTNAGASATFDIDSDMVQGRTTFDASLFLFDAAGKFLISNENDGGDIGSTSSTGVIQDPYLRYTFSDPGRYVIGVGANGSQLGLTDILGGNAPPHGAAYVLHVSLQNHPLAKSTTDHLVDQQEAVGLVAAENGAFFSIRNGNGFPAVLQSFGSGAHASSLAAGDLNGDGLLDVVTTDAFNNTVTVFAGRSNGALKRMGSYLVGNTPAGVAIADVNGDRFLDIVTANQDTADITALLGIGDGTFGRLLSSGLGRTPDSLDMADLNGDGLVDIVTSNDEDITVLLGRGDGTFAAPTSYATDGEYGVSVVLSDVNRDSHIDMVVGLNSGNIFIWEGSGDGSFHPREPIEVGDFNAWALVGDLNNDGYPDIVATANYNDGSASHLTMLKNQGDGTFGIPLISEPTEVLPAAIVDYDGDGIRDVLSLGSFSASGIISIARGNLRGGLSPMEPIGYVGGQPAALVVGDIEADGSKEVLIANWGTGDITILPTDSAANSSQTYPFPNPRAVKNVDLDNDGIQDLVAANGSLYISLGQGGGDFAAPRQVNEVADEVTPLDVNLDGMIDLVTAQSSGQSISILLGTGGGAFDAAQHIEAGDDPRSLSSGDFNHDGVPDVVTANPVNNVIRVLYGDGDGTFIDGPRLGTGIGPQSIVVADFNGDQLDDVATANTTSQDVSIFLGKLDGTLEAEQRLSVGGMQRYLGFSPAAIAAEDLNNDGLDDFAVLSLEGTNTIAVFMSHPDGTPEISGRYTAGYTPNYQFSPNGHVEFADLTGDGIIDIVAGGLVVSILPGNGDGTFQHELRLIAGERPQSIAVADFNGDNHYDIVAGNIVGDDISVLLSGQSHLVESRDGEYRDYPLRGTATVFTQNDTQVFYSTYDSNNAEIAIWSIDQNSDQVERIAKYRIDSGRDQPLSLTASPDSILIESAESLRILDLQSRNITAHRFASGNYGVPMLLSAGQDSSSLTIADVNGNGFGELIVANQGADTLTVVSFSGTGRPNSLVYQTGDLPSSLVTADFDRDGNVDIANTNEGSNSISVFEGDGAGGFSLTQTLATEFSPVFVVAGMVNDDIFVDIVTANRDSSSITVYFGASGGTFAGPIHQPVGLVPLSVAVADMNGNGLGDIVVAGRDSGVKVIETTPTGFVTPSSATFAGQEPASVALGDLNSDGHIDVVTLDQEDPDISVLLGVGDGSLRSFRHHDIGRRAKYVSVSDINSDGFLDVVAADRFGSDIRVLTGNGDGSFQPVEVYSSGAEPSSLAVGDINGDGVPDIATANRTTNSVSLLIGLSRLDDTVSFNDKTYTASGSGISVLDDQNQRFDRLKFTSLTSQSGESLRSQDFDVLQLFAGEIGLVATVRLRSHTARRGELDLLLLVPSRYNATATGVSLLRNSNQHFVPSDSPQLFEVGGRVFFTAEPVGESLGAELFAYSVERGVHLVADVLTGQLSSKIDDVTVDGTDVYFMALRDQGRLRDGVPTLVRQLVRLDTTTDRLFDIRAGKASSRAVRASGEILFTTQQELLGPPQFWRYDTSQTRDIDIGAATTATGSISGTAFLDDNGDGVQNAGEAGRAGVRLFIDLNNNGQLDIGELSFESASDDPFTPNDETGRFFVRSVEPGTHLVRELVTESHVQTTPFHIENDLQDLIPVFSSTRGGLSLPSVVGTRIGFADLISADLFFQVASDGMVPLVTRATTLPGKPEAMIQSLGEEHAQDGAGVVFTAILKDGRELVVTTDSTGQMKVVAATNAMLTAVSPDATSSNVILSNIEGDGNTDFDSLSIASANVGFVATTTIGSEGYYLGEGHPEPFAQLDHAQVILDGDNEIFLDRILDGSPMVTLRGDDLIAEKTDVDFRYAANAGWVINTRTGVEILPLTFLDRLFDVSVEDLTATFRAIDVGGAEGIYAANADAGLTKLVGDSTPVSGGGQFTTFGSVQSSLEKPAVAASKGNVVFLGTRATTAVPFVEVVAIDDLNGDGFGDVVAAGGGQIAVLIAQGNGTFDDAIIIDAQSPVEELVLGDVDGDGKSDIVYASFSHEVSLLTGNGDGTFQREANLGSGEARTVVLGDLNGDDVIDIIAGNTNNDRVSVFIGNGDGTFKSQVDSPTGDGPRSLVVADVDSDGNLDVITANEGDLVEDSTGDVSVLLGNGDGSFQAPVSYDADNRPLSVAAGDVNGDGFVDIVMANVRSDNVSVLRGNGDGSFNVAINYATGESPVTVAVHDVNGDGFTDIVTANEGSHDVGLLKGLGNGSFDSVVKYSVGDAPAAFAFGDIDSDGRNDVVTANLFEGSITVFQNAPNGSLVPSGFGLFAYFDDELRTIADTTTDFGGRVLTDISISNQAISGNRIVFRASFADGSESIFLAELPAEPVATVTVRAGETVSDVNFGAQPLPGVIRGASFIDSDTDGVFSLIEGANSGRRVFLDENFDGLWNESERSTVTDDLGQFVFTGLPSELSYVVREELPVGVATTTGETLEKATSFLSAGSTIEVNLGSAPIRVRGESTEGTVTGVVFNDVNGNSVQDNGELGIPNVTVFADENGNAVLNGGERSTTTGSDGRYTLDRLTGIRQVVHIHVPDGSLQLSPLGNEFTTSTLLTVDPPLEVVSGNFDGQPGDDLVVTIDETNEVQFFLNDGGGGFNRGPANILSGSARSIAAGHFGTAADLDGLVVGHSETDRVELLLPDEFGFFTATDLIRPGDVSAGGQYEALGIGPYFVTTGDFDGINGDDIAVVSQNNASDEFAGMAVFLNNGSGQFSLEQILRLPKANRQQAATAITSGQIVNGNGLATLDLVIANTITHDVTVVSNTGVGGSSRFELDGRWAIDGINPTAVRVGDLNNDGINEIITTNIGSHDISILTNNSSDEFSQTKQLPAGIGPAFAQLVDLDQDGHVDIAFTNSEAENRFGVLRNRGDGSFHAAETNGLAGLDGGSLAYSLAVGYFDDNNSDGVIDARDTPDIAVSNRSNDPFTPAISGVTVGLNAITPGAHRVDIQSEDVIDGLDFAVALPGESQLAGNVDGDGDFDANDSFLIHLVQLAGTNAQIDQSKGASSLTVEEIRTRISKAESLADVDGDGDFDANDSFLIHLVQLAGTNAQIDQSKGASSLTSIEIRANVAELGQPAEGQSQSNSPAYGAPVNTTVDSAITTQLFMESDEDSSLGVNQIPESADQPNTIQKTNSFRGWIDAI